MHPVLRFTRSLALGALLVGAGLPLSIAPRAADVTPLHRTAPSSLELRDLDGHPRSLAEFRGKRVLVNFWAAWCPPCLEEFPSLRRLAQTLDGDRYAVIAVNAGDPAGRVRVVARQHGLDFPVLLDSDGKEFARWGARVLPTSFVLDARGDPVFEIKGPMEWDSAEVLDLLEGGAGAPAP